MDLKDFYYIVKPFMSRRMQIFLRRQLALRKRKKHASTWPVSADAATPPPDWRGWPDNKRFAFVLTHDVETVIGQAKCIDVMNAEEKLGFRSSFNFVPERYFVSEILRRIMVKRGFEVGVHGLKHDGKLYKNKEIFAERAKRINQYIKAWHAVGFRSPAMHHNLDWIHQLDILYDASTFDTDPFEPQSDGVNTIFPFYVRNEFTGRGYVELPYTLVQDFTLFILLREKNIDIWKRKLDWIAEQGGMALLNVHPDYLNFHRRKAGLEEFPAEFYTEFLTYVKTQYRGEYWHALPRTIARFWVNRDNQQERYEQYVPKSIVA